MKILHSKKKLELHTCLRPGRRLCLAAILCQVGVLPFALAQEVATPPIDDKEPVITLEEKVYTEEIADLNSILPKEPTRTVFGLDKTPVDTPRSFTIVSSSMIDSMAIRNSEDVARIAPSTYSTFRFGLQGGVGVRGQTADFYFRGMRRIDPQGNYRTIFAANDSIDIVRGPPSPIYGLGRIGGYLNFNPKTARLSATGKYLDHSVATLSYTAGSFNKNILRLDVGGPLSIAGKRGGYQVFAYFEDTEGYYTVARKSPADFGSPRDRHKIVQATFTLDLNKAWRVEAGGVTQNSKGGLPGGINRTTQDLIDHGRYWQGTFAYNMDRNGDGQISDNEILDSYTGGYGPQQRLGASGAASTGPSAIYAGQNNDPLRRRIPWQGGPVDGGTITLDQFMAGYDVTLPSALGGQTVHRQSFQLMVYDRLLPNGQPDTSRAKVPFYMPFAFDPAPGTWKSVPYDFHLSFGEDFYKASINTGFLDLINDTNPNFVIKDQTLFDMQDQEKSGRNPFSQFQNIFQVENKLTVTKTFQPGWSWLKSTLLGSVNGFYHDSNRVSDNGDYDFRKDMMAGYTPNDTFFAFTEGDRTKNTSAANRNDTTVYSNWGVGLLSDTTVFDRVNFLFGGRYDEVHADSNIAAGLFNRQANGGDTALDRGKATDGGWSYSASSSVSVFPWLKPYVTYAIQAAPLSDASTGGLPPSNVRRGILAESLIKEGGIKGTFFNGRLFYATAVYLQTRNSYDPNDGAGSIGATESTGWEGEFRWVVNKKVSLNGGWSCSKTVNVVSSGNFNIDGRAAGFPDVVDASGKVVIPAEAFGWGGILSTNIPNGVAGYEEVAGKPSTVLNATVLYTPAEKLTFRLTGYYQNAFSTNQLKTNRVPPALALDCGVTYDYRNWDVKFSVQNLTDKTYYATGSFQSVSQRVPRSFEIALSRTF